MRLLCSLSAQVHNASNANQKEKYEADLKKEIKKLQVSCGEFCVLKWGRWYPLHIILSYPAVARPNKDMANF